MRNGGVEGLGQYLSLLRSPMLRPMRNGGIHCSGCDCIYHLMNRVLIHKAKRCASRAFGNRRLLHSHLF